MADKILHLDLDAFYPSVEVLDEPALGGKAVIVGGLGDRGVVASASYEARGYGVHSALPMAVARRRCPEGAFLQPRFDRYRVVSKQVFAIYRRWTTLLEPLSLDEAYLDVTAHPDPAVTIAHDIRRAVRAETGLTVSAGVSYNKFLAKLASDMDKPDGLTTIEPETAPSLLADLPVDKLWGVGPATARRLEQAGFTAIGQVAAATPERLSGLLGSSAARLVAFARGQDDRRVAPPGLPSSISAEVTVERDLRTWAEAAPHVQRFAARVEDSLVRHELWARTVTLKVRFHDFRTITRSLTPGTPLRERADLLRVARELARRVELRHGQRMRLIGLGVSNLGDFDELRGDLVDAREQLDLFDGQMNEGLVN